jgi:hypothetical protein
LLKSGEAILEIHLKNGEHARKQKADKQVQTASWARKIIVQHNAPVLLTRPN